MKYSAEKDHIKRKSHVITSKGCLLPHHFYHICSSDVQTLPQHYIWGRAMRRHTDLKLGCIAHRWHINEKDIFLYVFIWGSQILSPTPRSPYASKFFDMKDSNHFTNT